MTYHRHPNEAQDMAAGRAAALRGIPRHYNAFDWIEQPERHAAWDAGWKAVSA